MKDESKKPKTEHAEKEKVEDLTQKPVTDRDAQTVKGGVINRMKDGR